MQSMLATLQPLVLIVDDDSRSAAVLARMLRLDGYDVEVTTDGAAALARLARAPIPSAIVTERHLPHADGLAVSRYARSRRPGIPIFVVTDYPGSLGKESNDEPLQMLTKPLDYEDLRGRLDVALVGPRPV